MWIIDQFNKIVVRRNHKDSMFCYLFSRKENALSLYNAIKGTNYSDPNTLSVVTLEDVIFMHQKNDVSILFDSRLTLWEHQSTLNENMSLRGLLYYAHSMEGLFDENDKRKLYRKKLVKIPAPEYYVLYNGTEEAPERVDMKLSEAFEVPSEGYEWTAHLINVNSGHNDEIMDKCPPLKGFALFVHETRKGKSDGLSTKEAVDRAMKKTTEAGYLVDELGKMQREVKAMILTEFDAKAYEEDLREDIREEVREELQEENRVIIEAERKRADQAEAELEKYKAKYGPL